MFGKDMEKFCGLLFGPPCIRRYSIYAVARKNVEDDLDESKEWSEKLVCLTLMT